MLRLPRQVTFQHRPILRLTLQHRQIYSTSRNSHCTICDTKYEAPLRARGRCEHDPKISEHELAKLSLSLLFPPGRRSLCGNAQRFALRLSPAFFKRTLRLPRKVTFQHHQILHLPGKATSHCTVCEQKASFTMADDSRIIRERFGHDSADPNCHRAPARLQSLLKFPPGRCTLVWGNLGGCVPAISQIFSKCGACHGKWCSNINCACHGQHHSNLTNYFTCHDQSQCSGCDAAWWYVMMWRCGLMVWCEVVRWWGGEVVRRGCEMWCDVVRCGEMWCDVMWWDVVVVVVVKVRTPEISQFRLFWFFSDLK